MQHKYYIRSADPTGALAQEIAHAAVHRMRQKPKRRYVEPELLQRFADEHDILVSEIDTYLAIEYVGIWTIPGDSLAKRKRAEQL
jgi:hypothetical protein